MNTYKVQVGRDARVYYSATVQADSIEDAMSRLSRQGFDAAPDVEWKFDGVDDFDQVETCSITGPDGEADYTDSNGWGG